MGNLERLRELLGKDEFTYVADSKLCTRKNLRYIESYGGKFVTVLARTRVEDKHFRENLRKGDRVRWRRLLEIENKRRKTDPPDVYYTTADDPNETTEGYRIVWCRSSEKANFDAQVRQSNLLKAEAELFDLGTRLNRGKLKELASIKKSVKAILRNRKCKRFLKVYVKYKVKIQTKKLRPGRPKKDDPVRKICERQYHLEVKKEKKALRGEARTDGVFPLATNLEPRGAPKKEVLLIYKYQPYVEKRHALFKNELEVAPVYLKKSHRVASLIHSTFLAMVLDALIERTLRLGMKRHGIEELPILPEGRMSKTPTTARVLEIFTGTSWYEFERGDETVTFPIRLSKLQKLLLCLLEIAPSDYA